MKILLAAVCFILLACNTDTKQDSANKINLKRGDMLVCGPPGKEFGKVNFATSCSPDVKKDFDLGIALLHSFEYEEAEKAFAGVIDQDPKCAMAYWGVAMSNYHQVWIAPPTAAELDKGWKAISVAQSLPKSSARETEYINAMALFYKDHDKLDHKTRGQQFLNAMEKIYADHPQDKEAAIFYALALIGTADLQDKNYTSQLKAGKILSALYTGEPDHPGVVHYIIHAYDNPVLATLALEAARKYAAIAPSSAHAQHMPSHIFTRMGLWDESIKSNKDAASSARCYAENAKLKGHWDEELHCLDYLVYAYLQKGDNKNAMEQFNYLRSIKTVDPVSFKVAYAYAAIPARYYLENKMWKEAAAMQVEPAFVPWQQFPWQEAIIHFAKLMGSVNTGDITAARSELIKLSGIHDTLIAKKDSYKAGQVMIQLKTGEAWILFAEKKTEAAIKTMKEAVALEDRTEKAAVTPGEVLPANELLGDMLMQLNKHYEAMTAYIKTLDKHHNRFNALYGAGYAAEKLQMSEYRDHYYEQLLSAAKGSNSSRPELEKVRAIRKP